jgi:hypothetical protein
MEDGPEDAEGSYDYAGQVYRLVEHTSERWQVFLGDDYLGELIASPGPSGSGPEYTIQVRGDEELSGEPATDDWQRALQILIDNSAPPVGG